MLVVVAVVGCRDNTPPPQRVPIPAQHARRVETTTYRAEREDEAKPLPPPPQAEYALPFDDPPLLSQEPPEQPAFVDAYHRVGSPRMTVLVNRTLDGSLDYQAIETIMTDWLACNGNVTIISPAAVRQRLSDQQMKELQEGRPGAMGSVAQQLGAEILVHVQAYPTRKVDLGQEVRIVAEAMNTRGGQSIGRAVVDVPPPLEKQTINRYTRFLARKLMDDMISTWSAPPAPGQAQPAAPAGESSDAAGPRSMRPRDELHPPATSPAMLVPPTPRPGPSTQP
jgi:hypothetical protein